MLPLFIASVLLAMSSSAFELKLKKACGEIECTGYFYCDPGQLLCRDCEPVCNSTSNRYHPETCEENCQDYIHDHVKGYASLATFEDTINTIYRQQSVILILLVVLVALVGGNSLRRYYKYFKTKRQRRIEDKRFKEKLASVQYTINNNNALTDGSVKCISQPGMRSTLPSTTTLTTQTDTPCSTNRQNAARTLPLSNEEPSEDATLDYASYVNQALSHSPSNETCLNSPKY